MSKTTKALLVAVLSLCLSNCSTTFYRSASAKAEVVEDAVWVAPTTEVYQVNNLWYVEGRRGSLRGCQQGVPLHLYNLRGGAHVTFRPIENTGKTVYVPIGNVGDGKPWAERKTKNGAELHADFYGVTEERLLTKLPPQARKISTPAPIVINHHYSHHVRDDKGKSRWLNTAEYAMPLSSATTDAHAIYAWPLAAIIAVGVDLPCHVAGNAILLGGMVIAAPITAPVALMQQQSQQTLPSAEEVKPTPVVTQL